MYLKSYGKQILLVQLVLEVSGADVTTLNSHKSAIEATTRATHKH